VYPDILQESVNVQNKIQQNSEKGDILKGSIPDPPDPHVFGPPGSGSGFTSQRYGSGSFYHQAKKIRKTLIPTVL